MTVATLYISAGKASVVRRQFTRARILLEQAMLYAKDRYGWDHLRYADCLMEYAFYLLNVDEAARSVEVYTEALSVSFP